jgi:hypothetical protein
MSFHILGRSDGLPVYSGVSAACEAETPLPRSLYTAHSPWRTREPTLWSWPWPSPGGWRVCSPARVHRENMGKWTRTTSGIPSVSTILRILLNPSDISEEDRCRELWGFSRPTRCSYTSAGDMAAVQRARAGCGCLGPVECVSEVYGGAPRDTRRGG